jgi:hypothetical protein
MIYYSIPGIDGQGTRSSQNRVDLVPSAGWGTTHSQSVDVGVRYRAYARPLSAVHLPYGFHM